MLIDLLELYYFALQDGNEKDVERCLRDLFSIGVDKYTADMLLEELF